MNLEELSRIFCLQKVRGFKKNILLAPYTTFKIGGPAKYFFIAKKSKQVIEAIKLAKKLSIPYFVLGGGSNILVNDKGFNGLVIKIQNSNLKVQNNNSRPLRLAKHGGRAKFKIIVGAGVRLEKLVKFSIANNLTGLEWAAGVPGTLGGAIRGNSGAFGHSISESVKNVTVFNPDNSEINPAPFVDCTSCKKVKLVHKRCGVNIYNKKQCKFSYRESIFKNNKNIILSAQLNFKKGDSKKSLPPHLIGANFVTGMPKTPVPIRCGGLEIIKECLEIRKRGNPNYPSAGSVFKNLEVKDLDLNILKKFPRLKDIIKGGKIPAGYFIEACDLKGKKIGDAEIYQKHANFIVNLGNATAEQIVILISLIKQKVRNKFGIQLEEEIEYVGF